VDESFIALARKRPAMYVGTTWDGTGLHHMLWEVVGNSLDDHLAGHTTRIDVTFNVDGTVTVEDDGSGLPVHLVDGVPFAQLALTTMHTTGTLDGHAPHAHVGHHGVGICVVNALSSTLLLDVFRAGHHYQQRYAAGLPQSELAVVEETDRTGTRLTFAPDPKIFAETEMSFEVVAKRLRELAFFNPALRLDLRDDRLRRHSYAHPEGLRGFLDDPSSALVCAGTSAGIRVEAALRWSATFPRFDVLSFANHLPTTQHGSHVDGLLQGIADAVGPPTVAPTRAVGAVSHRLQAVVHVNIADPHYAGPTKDQLETPEAAEAVRVVVAEQLARHLRERPELHAMLRERIAG
jgi:DNA gyrase subunit B